MQYLATSVAFIVVLGCVCSGLRVGPVRLINNQDYIYYRHDNDTSFYVLQCPYTLEAGDGEVSKVSWILWKDGGMAGTFEYQPRNRTFASGLLEGKVNLERKDGSLQFTELEYDLSGYYSCAVTPTNGRTVEAEKWEVLIVDIRGRWIIREKSWDPCTLVKSFQTHAVFPELTVRSGIYSDSWGGFYNEVPASMYSKFVYPNKSVMLSYNDYTFEFVKDTPTDAVFMTTVGVTKSDNSYISLDQVILNSTAWTERGCPEMSLKEYQKLILRGATFTCRDEFKPQNDGGTALAFVECKKGYHGHGVVQELEFYCDLTSLNWTSPAGHRLSDLKCVLDGTDHDHNERDDDDDDDNAGMVPLASLTLLLTALTLHRLIH